MGVLYSYLYNIELKESELKESKLKDKEK